ncbi:unnamed protein product [Owenia fusiformis]|uniref:CRAL-TRIO domain-containing protein n=1 Tax=Owenia fusiformis TaxID=6347 RepID=A0A8S4Q9H6_OWEFU|nr:unnamed protein product [Owenia fusiformis]
MQAYPVKYSEFTCFKDILNEGKYIDHLDEKSKKKAKDELYEDPKERDAALKQFRDWIVAQPHYSVCNDDTFLLAFLRRCKYSQLEARTMFDIFHSATYKKTPEWMVDIDTQSKTIRALADTRCLLPLPIRDHEGRRIILWKPGGFNANTKKTPYNGETLFQLWGIFLYLLQREDMTQVNGYVFWHDGAGMTIPHITYVGADKFKNVIKVFYNNFPARIKKVVYYNCGAIMDAMMTVISPVLSQKIKDRFVVRSSMEEVYKKDIPMECLPREYLPDDYKGKCYGTTNEMHAKFWDQTREPAIQKKIWDLSHNYFKVDEKKRPDADIPQAAFRKLNVD